MKAMKVIYGLECEDFNNIISVIKRDNNISEAFLFGSRAKGNFRNGSDIDIALKGDQLSLQTIINLQIELEQLMLPHKIDIVIFDRIHETALIEHINRCGIQIYKKDITHGSFNQPS